MRLEDFLNNSQVDYKRQLAQSRQQRESQPFSLATTETGSDKVSLSAKSKAAQAASSTGQTYNSAGKATTMASESKAAQDAAAASGQPAESAAWTGALASESREAQAQASSSDNVSANTARQEFKHYMDKITGRVPSGPKSPEEKMKELEEKRRKLQNELSEAVYDTKLPDEVRSNRIKAVQSQLEAVDKEISELASEIAEQAQENGAGVMG